MIEILQTIAWGALKFIGIMIIVLPVIVGILFGTEHKLYNENRFARFYFVTWPLILLGGIGVFCIIMMFYHLGKT